MGIDVIAGTSSLPQLHDAILKSNVNVICVIHHGGKSIYNDVKPLIKPLAEQGRVTLVTLGEHVTQNVRADVEDWAERELFQGWETLPIRTLVPVSCMLRQTSRDASQAKGVGMS